MKKMILFKQTDDLLPAAKILQNGGLVVFPTETVYGLGANALDEKAVRSIFTAKNRPIDNPLIVHTHSVDLLDDLTIDVPTYALKLFEAFSPGPITIILKKRADIPSVVSGGLSTIAIRIPSHPIALKLLELSKLPIAAPSANISGRPSPTSFDMARGDMQGRVDAIIDGGDCRIGIESTVISMITETPIILRPGFITSEMISEILHTQIDKLETLSGSDLLDTSPRGVSTEPIYSPGVKYIHYKPTAEVYLTKDTGNINIDKLQKIFSGYKIGVMRIGNALGVLEKKYCEIITFADLTEYAKGLYKGFTEFDKMGVEIIIAQSVNRKGLGDALMNRLIKASGGKVV